jgi:hypothetical protein
MLTAPLPAGINGHFGPQLRRFVLTQYHQGQVTAPRLVALLRAFGIVISKRQVVRLLIDGQDDFLSEAKDVLRAGLSSASWITVDDTGACHQAANGICTQIGNAYFAWFGTTGSKSRGNFLELLRAGHDDYVINVEAVAYMRQRALAEHVIARLAEHPDQCFANQAAWTAHLQRLGISAPEVNPDPVLIATEGALWGSIKAHGMLPDTVIDRLKAVFIVMRVEQTQLLAAMHRVERVVEIERYAPGNLVKRLAIETHHGAAQAQQGARIGQVFQPRDRWLRTQFAIRRQKIERHLEHGIAAQPIGVVAVLVARRDHQQTKAHNSGERVRDLVRRARVDEAGGHPIGDAKALLDLAQSQNPAIRR